MGGIFSDKFTWLCAALAAGIAFTALKPADAPVPAHLRAPDAWRAPIGPGALPARIEEPAMVNTPLPAFLSADGQLLINLPLKRLFDDVLLRGQAGPMTVRVAQLRASLSATLPPPARAPALSLLPQYANYLAAHDALLARQQLALPPGAAMDAGYVERLAAWQSQRERLRQSTLPDAAVQAWFGADDAQLSDTIHSLRTRVASASGLDDGAEPDSNTLRARRLRDASQDQAQGARVAERLERATSPLIQEAP